MWGKSIRVCVIALCAITLYGRMRLGLECRVLFVCDTKGVGRLFGTVGITPTTAGCAWSRHRRAEAAGLLWAAERGGDPQSRSRGCAFSLEDPSVGSLVRLCNRSICLRYSIYLDPSDGPAEFRMTDASRAHQRAGMRISTLVPSPSSPRQLCCCSRFSFFLLFCLDRPVRYFFTTSRPTLHDNDSCDSHGRRSPRHGRL
jgi:hypothetical protein